MRLRGIEDEGRPPPFRVLWPLLTAALLAVFSLQEWVEGWVTPGHPAASATSPATSGRAASCIAIAIAARDRAAAARRALRGGGHRPPAPRSPAPPRPRCALPPLRSFFVPRLDVLAGNLAGRAPPLAS